MAITMELIKELREKTGVGIMDCKTALKECDGNIKEAVDFLRKKGIATAQKRSSRTTSQGQIQSYIHAGGKIGVLVEINCESDIYRQERRILDLRERRCHAHRREQPDRG